MPLQKMSQNEVLGNTAALFFKSGNILRDETSEYQQLVELTRLLPVDAFKIEWDIWYDAADRDGVKGFCYTDLMNQFLFVRPACTVRMYQNLTAAAKTPITEEGEDIFNKIAECSDKYLLRETTETPSFVIFLPGTNIFKKIVSNARLDNAIDQGAYLKQHPITALPLRGYLKKRFPEERVLDSRFSAYQMMETAEIVGSFTNSEMGLAALARNKRVFLFNDVRNVYTFSAVYNAISPGGVPSVDRFKSVLSCKHSGLIPVHAHDPRTYVDGFFNRFKDEYIGS